MPQHISVSTPYTAKNIVLQSLVENVDFLIADRLLFLFLFFGCYL